MRSSRAGIYERNIFPNNRGAQRSNEQRTRPGPANSYLMDAIYLAFGKFYCASTGYAKRGRTVSTHLVTPATSIMSIPENFTMLNIFIVEFRKHIVICRMMLYKLNELSSKACERVIDAIKINVSFQKLLHRLNLFSIFHDLVAMCYIDRECVCDTCPERKIL